jgi:acyl-CoA hydrolase
VEAENIRSGQRRHTNSCYFTMVAVDEVGRPVRVPELVPVTPVDIRRHKAAQLRRTLRREFAQRMEAVAETGRDVEGLGAD